MDIRHDNFVVAANVVQNTILIPMIKEIRHKLERSQATGGDAGHDVEDAAMNEAPRVAEETIYDHELLKALESFVGRLPSPHATAINLLSLQVCFAASVETNRQIRIVCKVSEGQASGVHPRLSMKRDQSRRCGRGSRRRITQLIYFR